MPQGPPSLTLRSQHKLIPQLYLALTQPLYLAHLINQ